MEEINMTTSNGQNLLVQGRIVWTQGSSLFEGKRKTDFNTKQPIIGQDGQPIVEYGFGLAVPKIDPRTGQNSEEFVKIWQTLHQEAFTLYPSGQIPPGFSMKFKDGDGIDHNGNSFSQREGYAGHIVLACTTQIPIRYFIFEGGNNIMVNKGIKCGDYVNVQLNVKAHPAKGQGKAGLYLNPSAVQLIAQGKEIINTPSGDNVFGQTPPAYAGQIVADTAPQMPNTAPQMPATNNPAPMYPQQQTTPHYGVLPQNMQPQQQAPQMPAMGGQQVNPQYAPPIMANVPTPGAIPAPYAYPSNQQQAPQMPAMPR